MGQHSLTTERERIERQKSSTTFLDSFKGPLLKKKGEEVNGLLEGKVERGNRGGKKEEVAYLPSWGSMKRRKEGKKILRLFRPGEFIKGPSSDRGSGSVLLKIREGTLKKGLTERKPKEGTKRSVRS